jgi:hypothetical protein
MRRPALAYLVDSASHGKLEVPMLMLDAETKVVLRIVDLSKISKMNDLVSM